MPNSLLINHGYLALEIQPEKTGPAWKIPGFCQNKTKYSQIDGLRSKNEGSSSRWAQDKSITTQRVVESINKAYHTERSGNYIKNTKGIPNHSQDLWNIHMKKIEAFCAKDSELIWIDCILSENHKDHKLSALEKAVEKENYILTQNQKELESLKLTLITQKSNFESNIDWYYNQGNT